jgi:hypothetical protein
MVGTAGRKPAAGTALALACALAACGGTTGTVTLDLATAPGSTVLDAVQQLRLTVTDPHQVIEAGRTAAGFDLAFDLDASGASGAVIVEGFDAAGALVACGQSPTFPVAAINAHIVVYMAAPRSIALAPVALPAARSEVSGTALDYGAVLAGGRDAGGAPSTAIAIYNAYDHTLVAGIPLPAARTGVALGAATGGAVYLFGGLGPDGNPTGTLWRFDTTVAPNGAFSTIADRAEFARTDQRIVPTSTNHYLITGTPALGFDLGTLAARTDIDALPAEAATVVPADGKPAAIFAGAQLVRYRQDKFDSLAGSERRNATAAALPGGRVVVIGGGAPELTRDALVIDAATGMISAIPDVLTVARSHPSVAATSRYVIVAGGTDMSGALIATAEVLDAQSLAPITTLPILPRTGVFAVALPTDQVLLVGGTPAAGQIELFTPEPPPL